MKPGDRIEMVIKDRRETRRFTATVLNVEERDGGLYFGYQPDDLRHGRWGYNLLLPEPRPFGLQSVIPLRSDTLLDR